MGQMTVCQTCGDEGYSALLIHCEQCEIVAVHRYCVDGPTNIDNDEVSWFCEDCVPRISQPVPAIRKSERIPSVLDREVQCEKARRNWRNHSSAKVKKSNCVGKSANKVANDASNLDDKKSGIVKRKQGNSKVSGIDLKNGDSEPALQTRQKPHTRQKKKAFNSKDGANKNSLESSLLTGQKTEDLSNFYIDDEDIQKKLEMNLDPQLSNEPEHCPEGTSKADEISGGDSVGEKWHKHWQSFSELHSNLLDEQHRIGCSEVTRQADGIEEKVSDSIEPKHVISSSHQRGEKQSGFSIHELQTPRKKRRVFIEMEYSDSEEEPNYVRDEHPQVVPDAGNGSRDSSSSEPLVKKSEYGLAQESFMNSNGHFPTQQSSIHSDNHMLPQTSLDFKNHSAPQLPPAIVGCYISVQPIISAIWRGHCSISNHVHPMSFGLEAHLSNTAHPKVHGAASALPNLLSFDIMQKHYAWPKSFEESPPMGDAIGLYFFPVEESDEKSYTCLLEEMIECDLALKSHINNLELLVFCSQELPLEERRFQSKYYLWGVFKQKKESSSDIQISDPMYSKRDFAVRGTNRSSASPLSIDTNSVMNSSNSCLRHEAGNSILKHPKPAYNEQGCNSHPASSGTDSLARTYDRRNSRSSCKPSRTRTWYRRCRASLYLERGSNLYKRNHEIVQGKPMEKWKDAPLRQSSHSRSSYRIAMC